MVTFQTLPRVFVPMLSQHFTQCVALVWSLSGGPESAWVGLGLRFVSLLCCRVKLWPTSLTSFSGDVDKRHRFVPTDTRAHIHSRRKTLWLKIELYKRAVTDVVVGYTEIVVYLECELLLWCLLMMLMHLFLTFQNASSLICLLPETWTSASCFTSCLRLLSVWFCFIQIQMFNCLPFWCCCFFSVCIFFDLLL